MTTRGSMAPRVLCYHPSNQRYIPFETQIMGLHQRGIAVELLTTCEAGPLHEQLEGEGIPTHTHPVSKGLSVVYYLRQVAYLVRFCRSRDFTAVFANLQHTSFIAVLAQYLLRPRVVVFRHHFSFTTKEGGGNIGVNRMERLFDAVINALARRIVVPSSGVYRGMEERERVNMGKVEVLPYVYDFGRYQMPDPEVVSTLEHRYPARLRLLIASRMVALKRHRLAFSVVEGLLRDGLDLVLLVLDDGPEREALAGFVRDRGLQDRIVMLGFRADIMNVIGASDLLLHPSLTEASSSMVKESGLLSKPVIACEGVGDFDDYLVDGENAFVVPRATEGPEIAEAIRRAYSDPSLLERMGRSLREAVLDRFAVDGPSMGRYLELATEGTARSSGAAFDQA